MLELQKGDDILEVVGGVHTNADADAVFEKYLNKENLNKLSKIKNEKARLKIANAIALCQPKDVFIHTGSKQDMNWVRQYALKKGEEKPLALKGADALAMIEACQANDVRLMERSFNPCSINRTTSFRFDLG